MIFNILFKMNDILINLNAFKGKFGHMKSHFEISSVGFCYFLFLYLWEHCYCLTINLILLMLFQCNDLAQMRNSVQMQRSPQMALVFSFSCTARIDFINNWHPLVTSMLIVVNGCYITPKKNHSFFDTYNLCFCFLKKWK